MGTFERVATLVAVLVIVVLHALLARYIRTQAARPTAGGSGLTAGPARRWLTLFLAWVFLCGLLGAALYAVTSFAFAFSGTQNRMVPVINAAFWIVELGTLAIGAYTLARRQSLRIAIPRMLLTAAIGWCVAVGVEWLLAGRR